ncbi:MAG: hypothetical protein F4186_01310 [Boseongicola sp. SB0676_bin_33]|uniref:Resolvase/invertase-type recombinase catalytic domain-containing protein n=1 Tax=Boseongicola sp. SB0664_bin_43 TaxID=2604844 RepID=A0A6B0Y157_9RHOB|nr:hypothetical protein [Boseongicola sp. SB0664_bin_43]MYF88132.1 hypothetical protein [Boseongicola sp. SB0676_bin_33]MYK33201.1 hypothetical protein [Boseongicola sp. SB0670_bin_30]
MDCQSLLQRARHGLVDALGEIWAADFRADESSEFPDFKHLIGRARFRGPCRCRVQDGAERQAVLTGFFIARHPSESGVPERSQPALHAKLRSLAAWRRPWLEAMSEQLGMDDVVVVTRPNRLARSTTGPLCIPEAPREKGAGVRSLDEAWADTTGPAGKMILAVLAALPNPRAPFARHGRRKREADGVTFGRRTKVRGVLKEPVRELALAGRSISSAARTFDVHPVTTCRCIRESRPS